MKPLNKIIVIALLATAPLSAALENPLDIFPENIVINNRILLKVEGKSLTVMDVVKKMDLLFYRQYPDLASSPVARYQFYVTGWRSVLNAVLDELLIVADAKEKGVEVNDGEVREELEKLFGPDVVFNLDKLGMTLDEAFDLLKTELMVQRMMGMMVRSKALTDVHPSRVRERYEKWLTENPPFECWIYRVMSIRGENHLELAEKAYQWMQEGLLSLETVAENLRNEGAEVNLSEEYNRKNQELSVAHRAILSSLGAAGVSPPDSQKNVSRIFCLQNKELKAPSSFSEAEEKIKKQLLDESFARHNQTYREKLRIHYGLTDKFLKNEIPDNLEPFSLR